MPSESECARPGTGAATYWLAQWILNKPKPTESLQHCWSLKRLPLPINLTLYTRQDLHCSLAIYTVYTTAC